MRWVKDYLSFRTQCVVVDGAVSDSVRVVSGVPQGSILGPLLFAIYVNGVTVNVVSLCSQLVLWADDLLSFRPVTAQNDFCIIQDDIDSIEDWSSGNFLTFNSVKCKYMVISRKRCLPLPSHPLLLCGNPLVCVD